MSLQLFKFQAEGIRQLAPHRSSLNADEMGLGKTVQAIVLDVERRKKHNCGYTAQTLVVTVTSMMGSWEKEFNKWAPWLKVKVIDRKNRTSFLTALQQRDGNGRPEHHVFICHWPGLRLIAKELAAVKWFHVIGDEIHAIKNRKAQQTQSFKKIRTYYKTGLSGTWADNKPDDAWSVLNWLWPDYWRSYWAFVNHHVIVKSHPEGYCIDCNKNHGRAYRETVGVHDEALIHQTMGSAYVRRLKKNVIKDLPDKYYSEIEVDLTPQQEKAYEQMRREMLAWVGEHEDQPIAAPVVIAQLTRLQQFACAYGKLETKLKDGQPYKILTLAEPSSKLDAVEEILGETNGQVVVFGQSKQVIYLLEARLRARGLAVATLTGDTAQADRDVAVQEFQSGARRVFLSTIKAGGIGITLTAASTCIFLDRAWSPSANRQAEDRLHRVGQKNAVHIIDLVARRTIDRGRNQQIEQKWEWLKAILDPRKDRQ